MTLSSYTLSNGVAVPQIGLGTYMLRGKRGVEAITAALDLGYRFLDTAYNYENEGTVGEAVRQSSVSRDAIQISSKLPGRYHQYADALVAIEESLYRGNLDYYDFYLIHWPNPNQGHYVEAWQALIEAQKRGYVKNIGLSNFLPEHIDNLIKETGVKPVINQVEMHPYFHQAKQRAYHAEHHILTQAWSPLGRADAKLENPVLDLDIIVELSQKYRKTPGQIILRWHIQNGAMPIPKSSHKERLQQNIAVFDFELTAADMAAIKAYDHPNGRMAAQNPAIYEEF